MSFMGEDEIMDECEYEHEDSIFYDEKYSGDESYLDELQLQEQEEELGDELDGEEIFEELTDYDYDDAYGLDSIEDLLKHDFLSIGYRLEKWYTLPNRKREPKNETRTGCEAQFQVKFVRVNGRWHVTRFSNVHNHKLLEGQLSRLLPGHRSMSKAEIALINNMRKKFYAEYESALEFQLCKLVLNPLRCVLLILAQGRWTKKTKESMSESSSFTSELQASSRLCILNECARMMSEVACATTERFHEARDLMLDLYSSYKVHDEGNTPSQPGLGGGANPKGHSGRKKPQRCSNCKKPGYNKTSYSKRNENPFSTQGLAYTRLFVTIMYDVPNLANGVVAALVAMANREYRTGRVLKAAGVKEHSSDNWSYEESPGKEKVLPVGL
ncbi:hypothetical protein Ahy_B10g102884 [Arachis hypogaea]|uniref:FAR1 domain-containing protein n=1 Tax=Arachis hypogaea TaxID=3818 RepID=A0A444X316_ARAHY|nr:hypothetical protein Ahy_B10g102884 [Arachis hypogaea]